MPLTELDQVVALVMIDLQKGIVGLPTAHPASEIVAKSAELAGAFRERGLPVVIVNVTGRAPGRTDVGMPKGFVFPPDWTELVPELGVTESDILVTKERIGAFLGTALGAELKKRGVTQVVMTGVATGSGVEATARSAHDLGYNVVLVADAMTDMDKATHDFFVEKGFPKIGEVCSTEDVLAKLKG